MIGITWVVTHGSITDANKCIHPGESTVNLMRSDVSHGK